jgi:hypothetical protein
MLSRRTDAVRLCVRRTPASAFLTLLPQLGWSGDVGRLRSACDGYFEILPDPTVHVDIGERVGPRLGFDLPLARSYLAGQPRDEPRWTDLFSLLAADQLATVEKRDALLAWPGGARLTRQEDLMSRSRKHAEAYLIRGLSHVKLVCDETGIRSAKGYFACQHLEDFDLPSGP